MLRKNASAICKNSGCAVCVENGPTRAELSGK